MARHRVVGYRPSGAALSLVVAVIAWAATAAIAAAPQAAGQAAAAPQAAAGRGLLAEEAFKNVQVLKGVPVDDFLATMGLMCAALGNDCADCHQAAGTQFVNWAADTPRKVMARRMVAMVNAINRDNFGGRVQVTCWTCHRNRDRPETTPTMEVIYGSPILGHDDVILPTQGNGAAAAIFDKYIKALGGTDRLSKVKSYEILAKSVGFGGFGGNGTVRIFAEAPDRRTTIIEFPDAPDRGLSVRSYNGTDGWVMTPLSVLGEYTLRGSELDGARVDAMLAFPSQIGSLFTNLRVGEPDEIDGKENQVVQGEGPNRLLVTMYFDADSGLLSRVVRYGSTPIGRAPTQEDYADYQDVNGVKMPFRWTFSWLDGRDSFQVSDVRLNVPIAPERFQRPTVAAGK